MTIARGRIAAALMVAAATAAAGAQDYVTFKDQASQDLFLASRAAVSRSEGSIKTLHSLLMRGHARIVQDGEPPAESDVVIKILLPDAYLRIDTMGTMVKTTGFEGNHLLTSIMERGESSVPPPSMTASLIRGERARVTRLLLGATASLTPTLRLVGRTAPGIGSMERPGVGAPVGAVYDSANELRLIELSGDEGFYTRFVIDTARLPVRLEYRATKNEIWTMTFGDRREVGGLLMPYHIVTEGRGAIREDLRLDEIRVNPEIGRGDFKR